MYTGGCEHKIGIKQRQTQGNNIQLPRCQVYLSIIKQPNARLYLRLLVASKYSIIANIYGLYYLWHSAQISPVGG